MKKKYILILIIFLFLLSGCNSKIKKQQKQIEKEVTQTIKDTENISIKEITTAINYINDKYEFLKKNSKEQEQILKYATYLEKIGTSSDKLSNNSITKLGQITKDYALNLKVNQKNDLKDLLNKITRNQTDLINEFYNTYHEDKTMQKAFTSAKSKLKDKNKEKDFVNLKSATKYLNYLISNYKNPLKNSEVTEKTTYYLEYFLMIGQKKNCQDNDIIKFAQTTKDYFFNNDNQLSKNIEKYLDNIDQNKTKLLDDLVTNYNK